MSIRLKVLSAGSKLLFKPALARIKNLIWLRYYLDFVTKANGVNPKGALYKNDVLSYKDQSVPAVWAYGKHADKSHVLLYIHGGGFIFGSAATHKHLAADIVGQLGIKAVLPNYRLAPESPYPMGFDDIVTSYRALLEMGYTSQNIIIGGDSAGGNLSFALLAYIKANNLPMPACAFTFAALTNMAENSDSLQTNASSDCVLAVERFDDMQEAYAPNTDLKSPYISPIYADFTGVPPVLLQASKGEMLLDDSKMMQQRLASQGVDARLSLFDNNFHVFQILRGLVPEANQAITEVVAFIKPHISES